NHFGYQFIIVAKIEFIAHPDFTSRIYNNIPQTIGFAEFAKQKDFNLSTCFFLPSVKTGRKNFGVIHNHHILVVKIVDDVFKNFVFYFSGVAMNYHKATFVTLLGWMLRDKANREIKLELG